MKLNNIITLVFIIIITACQKNETENIDPLNSTSNGGWLVPIEDVVHTGEHKDQIPSIDDPHFISVTEANWHDNDIVYIYDYNGITKIYPQVLLEGHEIVNDVIENHYYSVTYCPITGSGICWNRNINNHITEFGVSGILYNENLVPYDRNTDSYWSQMRMQSIYGPMKGVVPEYLLLLKTEFSTAKSMFPDANVLTSNEITEGTLTDDVSVLKQSKNIIDPNDTTIQLPRGELLYGIIASNKVLIIDESYFSGSFDLIQTSIDNLKIVVIGNRDKSLVVAFILSNGAPSMNFLPFNENLSAVMIDDSGNKYDIFGKIISGPDLGYKLTPAKAYFARGFAWNLFFDQIEILTSD